MSKRYLLIGGSRGIGAAVAKHFADRGDTVISVSRTPSAAGEWVQADISTAEGIKIVVDAVGEGVIDGLLFMGASGKRMLLCRSLIFAKVMRLKPALSLLLT